MMKVRSVVIIVAVIVALFIASDCFFSVGQRQRALVLQFGEIKQSEVQPGLHFKWPLLQQVYKFDHRILSFDTGPSQYSTADGKTLVADAFVKWRMADIADFYRAAGGDEVRASDRLSQILHDVLRKAIGKHTEQEAVSARRDDITTDVGEAANAAVKDMGIQVVDVRFKRIGLPDKVAEVVYDHMRNERKQLADTLRAQGKEAAARIRADGERQRTEILSSAYAQSQKIRGEGDAKAAAISAEAYGKDPEFYRFYKSLQIYKNGWQDKSDVLVLDLDSKLFRYFQPPEVSSGSETMH